MVPLPRQLGWSMRHRILVLRAAGMLAVGLLLPGVADLAEAAAQGALATMRIRGTYTIFDGASAAGAAFMAGHPASDVAQLGMLGTAFALIFGRGRWLPALARRLPA